LILYAFTFRVNQPELGVGADSGSSRTVIPAHRGQGSGDRGQFLTNVQA
jgi:hypothetical protein